MESQIKILLLDDEPLILMDLELAAEDCGCVPICARNVEQALDAIEAQGPDCAVLDVTLQRGESCVPVARELDARGIPYLLHTGDLDRRDEAVRELDAMLIAKPAASDHVIREAMGLAREEAGTKGAAASR